MEAYTRKSTNHFNIYFSQWSTNTTCIHGAQLHQLKWISKILSFLWDVINYHPSQKKCLGSSKCLRAVIAMFEPLFIEHLRNHLTMLPKIQTLHKAYVWKPWGHISGSILNFAINFINLHENSIFKRTSHYKNQNKTFPKCNMNNGLWICIPYDEKFHTRTEQAHSETKQQSSLKKFQQKFSLFKMLYISLRWNPPKMQSLVYLVKCLWKSTHKCLYKQTDRTKHVTLLSKRCTCFENWSLMKMSKLNWNGPLKHQFWLQENTSSKYHLKQNSLHHMCTNIYISVWGISRNCHIYMVLCKVNNKNGSNSLICWQEILYINSVYNFPTTLLTCNKAWLWGPYVNLWTAQSVNCILNF